ncbi:MAG: hypothetical protein K6E35_01865 [Bacteroidales bacterium]|nr:hypothetical protein [Bacteroidales bacterium]
MNEPLFILLVLLSAIALTACKPNAKALRKESGSPDNSVVIESVRQQETTFGADTLPAPLESTDFFFEYNVPSEEPIAIPDQVPQ